MKKIYALILTAILTTSFAQAHCQVPCGVYTDEMRFGMIEEDFKTIEKAMSEITRLASSTKAEDVAKVIRWTTTKETHASHIQQVVAEYFMTQRIKPNSDMYVEKITALHQMLIAAMQCKQTLDPNVVVRAREATASFHALYFPKAAKAAHDHAHGTDHKH